MPPQTRIPQPSDFTPLTQHHNLHISVHHPSPPESTTAILLLFHGLGDCEAPFASFARAMALPGILAIAVRGTSALPPAMLGLSLSSPSSHFHWGDDLRTAADGSDGLDPDPGFEKAADLVLRRLVGDVLVDACGWDLRDVLLFGFGQGGSLALGLASRVRMGARVVEVVEAGDPSDGRGAGTAFKGVVSIGGPLPPSMIPTVSARPKSKTPVLVCAAGGDIGSAVDDEEFLGKEFEKVEVVRWRGRGTVGGAGGTGMPGNREEMLPIMRFFAERLRDGW